MESPGYVEFWEWVGGTYLQPEIARRVDANGIAEGAILDRAQVVFRPETAPEVRLGGELRGQEVIEGRLELGRAMDLHGAEEEARDVSNFELPEEDRSAGHVTAFNTASGLELIVHGCAINASIQYELDGADEFIDSAQRALAGPLGPFASSAYSATEMLARAELLRLPDPTLNSVKTHRSVRARYNRWARFGNTRPEFASLLNSLADLETTAKYRRSQFALTPEEAVCHMETLMEMRQHADQRLRQRRTLPPGEYRGLVAVS